jgi:iron-sulfur cluster assembly accessory protein
MIRVTEAAKEKIISILNEEKATILRFGLQGGGCNGFTYFFAIENESVSEDDFLHPLSDSHILVVDAASSMYLEEAEIDYKKDIMGESFIFNNPNTKTNCGCGNSVGF